MAIVFMDGFAHYNVSQAGRMYNTVANSTNIAIGTSYGRGGLSGVRIGQNSGLTRTFPIQQGLVVGFAFYLTALPSSGTWVLCSITGDSAAQQNLRVDSTGVLSICSGTTSNPFSGSTSPTPVVPGQWYYCEYKSAYIGGGFLTTGRQQVRINGVPFVNTPAGTNTNTGGNYAVAVTIGQGSGSASTYSVYFADLLVYHLDDPSDPYFGDKIIQTLLPASDGSVNDFSVTGASSAYEAVVESPPDLDTSYVSSSTVDARQTFVMSSPGFTPANIVGVQLFALAKTVDTGRKAAAGGRNSGTDYDKTAITLATDYTYIRDSSSGNDVFEQNPDTDSAWIASDLASLEAGVTLDT